MFTGLISDLGTLTAVVTRGEGRAVTVRAPETARDLRTGESVAVDGCCLSVESMEADQFTLFASPETLAKTTLGARSAGEEVNLERPLALGDRLGGHLVTGHVDGIGTVDRYESLGESWLLEVRFPRELAPFLVEKGSVAVDGISLTTVDVTDERFRVAIIPETHRRTTLHRRSPGDAVNLEADLIGKYVARLAALRQGGAESRVTEELLVRAGFLTESVES